MVRLRNGGPLSHKGKETLTPAATCMNLGDVMLSDLRQPRKDKYRRVHFPEVPRVFKFKGTVSGRVRGHQGLGRGLGVGV